jgi:hypothetical protein
VAGRGTAVAARRGAAGSPPRSQALLGLVSRLMFAQAGASAAVSLSYSRRNVPSVILAVLVALALCGLAGLLRSASPAVWLTTVTFEAGFVAVGLFRFTYARYLGGTLLAIITLGTLLHPAVARVIAGASEWPDAAERPAIVGSLMSEGGS